jgi:hypothetical protein
MKRLIESMFILVLLFGLLGCPQTGDDWFGKTITDGGLSQFGIPGIEKIGDWYSFKDGELKVWVRINKATIEKYEGFANMLYFDEAKIVYPSSWEITLIRSNGNLYQIKTKNDKGYAAFFIGLLGSKELVAKDGKKWFLKKDENIKTIETTFMRKDIYDKLKLNW